MLVNLLHEQQDIQINQLTNLLIRIENLSHILMWKDINNDMIQWIELPRLKLSFYVKNKLFYCKQLADYYLSDLRYSQLHSLCQGLSSFNILLENSKHELTLLIPNTKLIRPKIPTSPFNTQLIPLRNDIKWLSLMNTPYYLYSVHISRSYLITTSLAARFYLALNFLLHRQYKKTYELIKTCDIDTTLTEEESFIYQQFEQTLADKHPNAYACRLRLYLNLYFSTDQPDIKWYETSSSSKAWIVEDDYADGYLAKIMHVSNYCRLTLNEEEMLISKCKIDQNKYDKRIIRNRKRYIDALRLIENNSDQDRQIKTLISDMECYTLDGIKLEWHKVQEICQSFFKQIYKANQWKGSISYDPPTLNTMDQIWQQHNLEAAKNGIFKKVQEEEEEEEDNDDEFEKKKKKKKCIQEVQLV